MHSGIIAKMEKAALSGEMFGRDLRELIQCQKESTSEMERILSVVERTIHSLTASETLNVHENLRQRSQFPSESDDIRDDFVEKLRNQRSDRKRMVLIVASFRDKWVSVDTVFRRLSDLGYEIDRRTISSGLHKLALAGKLEHGRRGSYRIAVPHTPLEAAHDGAVADVEDGARGVSPGT